MVSGETTQAGRGGVRPIDVIRHSLSVGLGVASLDFANEVFVGNPLNLAFAAPSIQDAMQLLHRLGPDFIIFDWSRRWFSLSWAICNVSHLCESVL